MLRVRERWLATLLAFGRENRVTAPDLVAQLDELLAGIEEARALVGADCRVQWGETP
jgi:hypothetical protein